MANGILQAFLGLLQLPAASFEERVVVEKSYLLLESGVLGGQVVGASGFGHKLIGFGRVVGGHGEVGQLGVDVGCYFLAVLLILSAS